MIVDIHDIPTVVITLDRNGKRYSRLRSQLSSIGVSESNTLLTFDGIRHENPVIGCALSHFRALQIFDPPFLILEDDASIIGESFRFSVPDHADALYLGYFSVPHRNEYSKIPQNNPLYDLKPYTRHYSPVDGFDEIKRIHSVMSTHAIVYLSSSYLDFSLRYISDCIETCTDIDVMFSKFQLLSSVYAVNNPLFCQLDDNKPDFYEISRHPINIVTDWQGNILDA